MARSSVVVLTAVHSVYVAAEDLPSDSVSPFTASPALNYRRLHSGPPNAPKATFEDDIADDMWALGVTFHDMVSCTGQSGKTAFQPKLSDLQALQAERPDDSDTTQLGRAFLNEQLKWVSISLHSYTYTQEPATRMMYNATRVQREHMAPIAEHMAPQCLVCISHLLQMRQTSLVADTHLVT